jgi:hypothetical protein
MPRFTASQPSSRALSEYIKPSVSTSSSLINLMSSTEFQSSPPDFRSKSDYLPRVERFNSTPYPFDPNAGSAWASLATAPGVLSHTGGQASLTPEYELRIALFNKNNDKGLYVDDVIALSARWLRSLRQDPEREAAAELLSCALLLLDSRSVKAHGYEDSPLEAANPPPKDRIVPSEPRWQQLRSMLAETLQSKAQ